MRRWRKGGFEALANWVELSFFGMLIAGFVLGKVVVDATFAHILVATAGLISGRLVYVKRQNNPVPFQAISLAFIVGYLIGHRIGNGIIITFVFASAAAASYYLHKNLDFLA
ncbi:hypothetical protein HYV83_02225 [Candidatus Woesearchaeota archaeon]|nr:hypothetical protein [Candidatus Woesearchaeota archaeon]